VVCGLRVSTTRRELILGTWIPRGADSATLIVVPWVDVLPSAGPGGAAMWARGSRYVAARPWVSSSALSLIRSALARATRDRIVPTGQRQISAASS